jgi:hypothetical protein
MLGRVRFLTIKRTCLDPKDAPDGLGRCGHGRHAHRYRPTGTRGALYKIKSLNSGLQPKFLESVVFVEYCSRLLPHPPCHFR